MSRDTIGMTFRCWMRMVSNGAHPTWSLCLSRGDHTGPRRGMENTVHHWRGSTVRDHCVLGITDWAHVALVISFCLSIMSSMMEKELIKYIDQIAWDDKFNAAGKVLAIQNLLYQYEQNMDARSIEDYRAYEQSFVEAVSEHI